jgi:hypothetical protein
MARCDLGPLLTERLGARENPCRLSDNLSPMPEIWSALASVTQA